MADEKKVEEPTIKEMMIDELKKAGLDIAEDAAVSAARAVIKMLPKVVAATENKIDDMLIPVLGILEPKLLELLDKIDGEDDPGY